ncbi:MAG: InlB B-repeat-containing protein [Clostridiales bacterium]|nr:InlB B-repeat-containing protein [Clostridiales bacterium]
MKRNRIVLLLAILIFTMFGFTAVACGKAKSPETKTFTVTFDLNYEGAPNGGVYKTSPVESGKTVAKPSDPNRTDGYTFVEWTENRDGTGKWNFSTKITKDKTLYAQWKEQQKPVLTGIRVTPPTKTVYFVDEEFSKDGMAVTAVYSDASANHSVDIDECNIRGYDMHVADTYIVTVEYKGFEDTFDITVKEPKTEYVDVTFNQNTDYDVSGMPDKQTVVKGEKAQEPSAPSVKGFTFDGWYTEDGEEFGFDSAVNCDVELFAHWTAKSYTVNYIVEGGAAPTNGTYTATSGVFEPYALEVAHQDHYTFDGWYLNSEYDGKKYEQLTYDDITDSNEFTFYGKFTPETYTIEYRLGGSVDTYSATWAQGYTPVTSYSYGSTVALPTAENIVITAAEGSSATYNFVGWLLDGKVVGDISATDFGGKILTANITSDPIYTVTYDHNYENGPAETRDVKKDGTAPNLTPTRKGYTFDAWYHDAGCTNAYDFETETVAGNITLYANWTADEYSIIYVLGEGGENHADNPDTYTIESEITLENPTREHYDFDGWYNGDKKVEKIEKGSTGSITLTAHWTPKKYSIIYVLGEGGENHADNPDTYTIESEITLEHPTREHYTFEGWYLNGKKVEKIEVGTTGEITLTAAWEAIEYTLEYNTGLYGETIESKTFTIETFDTVATLPEVTINAAGVAGGYYLLGWYTAGDGGDKIDVISTDELINLNGKTLTVFAQYSNLYTVTFDVKGGALAQGAAKTQSVAFGLKITEPSVTRSGYKLLGWKKDGGTAYWNFDSDTMPAENITLYAVWEENPTNGLYLRITYNNWETSEVVEATANEDGSEYTVKGVRLAQGANFYIADYKNGNVASDGYVKPSGSSVATYVTPDKQISGIAFGVASEDYGNYTVTTYNKDYNDFTWDMYVHREKVSVRLSTTNTALRNPDGTANPEFTPDAEDKAVYIMGEFNRYSPSNVWSNESMMITTAHIGTKYYFTGVQINKYDQFKIYVAGAQKGKGTWYGIDTDKAFKLGENTLSSAQEAFNIVFTVGASGLYDLVFDTNGNKLTVAAHKTLAVTINKTVYVGDTLTKDDITVKSNDKTVTDYTLYAEEAQLGDDNTLTVVYSGTVFKTTYTAYDVEATGLEVVLKVTEYTLGDTFSLDGAEVRLVKNNNTFEPVTDMSKLTVSQIVLKNVGEQIEITITHEDTGLTATVKINVSPATVTFISAGGSDVEPVSITEYGQKIDAPVSEMKGYELLGWFAADSETAFDFATTGFTGSMTLTAKWRAKDYTVTYDANGGTVDTPKQNYTIETEDLTLATPTRDHRMFDGWFTDRDGGIKVEPAMLIENPQDITLYAHWSFDSHTVEFDIDGGEGKTPEGRTVTHGEETVMPDAPTKTGYSFGGWYNGTVTKQAGESYTVEDDTVFTAIWTAEEYAVTFVFITSDKYTASFADGYTAPTSYTYGEGLTLPTAEFIKVVGAGYEFKGWAIDKNPTANSTLYDEIGITETGEKTFYAFISDKASVDFTFDYNYDGADPRTKTVQVVIGRAVTEPAKPTREGYEFKGWYNNKEGLGDKYVFGSSVLEKTTVYAKWERLSYTVTFETNGGSAVDSATVYHGETVSRPSTEPTKKGYTFAGWYKNSDCTELWNFEEDTVKAATTIYAKWTANDVTVTFNADGGTPEPASRTYKFDSALPELPVVSKAGYEFIGWFDGGKKWQEGDTLNVTELNLTAQWEAISYTIEYVVNVSVNGTAVKANAVDARYTVFTVEKIGFALPESLEGINPSHYLFVGWVDAQGKPVTSISLDMFEDGRKITLTATYELRKYTVTFDANGGKLAAGTSETVQVTYGETVKEPAKPTRTGWTFAGWYLGNSAYDFKQAVKSDIKLVAQWNGSVGTFLYYTTDGTNWINGQQAKKDPNADNQYKIDNVTIYNNMQFLVVTRKSDGTSVYLKAAGDLEVGEVENAMTVTSSSPDNNFKITNLKANYVGATWTIYIYNLQGGATVGSDGSLNYSGSDAYAKGISIRTSAATVEVRDPSTRENTNASSVKVYEESSVKSSVAIYLPGSFTNNFKFSDEWSSSSTLLTVLKSGNVYTFRHVYLKKGDLFKVYLPSGATNQKWYGGNFTAVNTPFTLSYSSQANIYLGSIADDYYDIVFNTSTKQLTIKTYVAPVITEIKVTVSKTEYKVGEPFDASTVKVEILDSDGKNHNTEYTISTKPNTNVKGDNVEGVIEYTGNLGGERYKTFTINVKQIVVSFVTGDGATSVDDLNPLYMTTFTLPEAPSKTGYEFKGWSSGATIYAAGAQYEGGVADDMTFTAVWEIKKYTVTFMASGEQYGEIVTVEHGQTLADKKPADPKKTGYTFRHWSANGEGGSAYNFEAKVTGNLTLTAVFEINVYEVEFIVDGKQYKLVNVEHNEKIGDKKPADPSKKGYEFKHWSADGESGSAYDFDTAVTDDVTLTAVFEIVKYSIDYVYEDCGIEGVTEKATFTPEYIEYTVESNITLGEPTPPAGVTFVAWHVGSKTGPQISALPSEYAQNLVLYAEYTKNPTVEFVFDYNYPDKAQTAQPADVVNKIVSGLTVEPPAKPTLEGYEFKGWFAEGASTEYDFTQPVNERTVVYAKWEILTYTVTFDINGGKGEDPESQEVEYLEKVQAVADPERDGYTFGGWKFGSKTWSFEDDVVTSNISLIADWTPIKYTITYVLGDGGVNGEGNPEFYYVTSETISLKPATRKHYEFTGWHDGNGIVTGISQGSFGNITLTAQWRAIEYTVEYNVSGTVGGATITADSVDSAPFSAEQDVVLPTTLTGVTKGYKFVGWTFGGKDVTEVTLSMFEDARSITLTAKYEIIVYSITYNLDSGTNGANPTTYKVTDGTVELKDASKAGYDFKGWYTAASNGDRVTELTIDFFVAYDSSKAIPLYAIFEKVVKVDGIYDGDTLVKAFVVSDEGKEFAAKFIKVESASSANPFKFKIYVNNAVVTTNTNLKDGSDSNVTVSNSEFAIKKSGIYTMYYRYKVGSDGNATGVYFTRHGEASDFVEPGIVDGDGIYVGGKFTAPFVFNDNNMNQVMAQGVTVTASDNNSTIEVTFKYAGKDISLTYLDVDSKVTNAGTDNNVKLYSGKYNFYYNYAKNGEVTSTDHQHAANRMWIDGEQTGGPKLVIPEGAVKVSKESSFYLVGKFGDSSVTYEYGFEMSPNGSSTTEFMYTKNLVAGDMFAVYRKDWNFWCTTIENSDYMNTYLESEKIDGKTYMKVKSNGAGSYTFYFKNEYNNDRIYIAFTATGSTEKEIVLEPNSAIFKFNDGMFVLQLGYMPTWADNNSAFAYDGGVWANRYLLNGSTYIINKNKSAVSFMVGFTQGGGGKNTDSISCSKFTNDKVNKVTNIYGKSDDFSWKNNMWEYTLTTAAITYK